MADREPGTETVVDAGGSPNADLLSGKARVEDLPLAGQRVLVRVDYNVPVADGRVTDDTRIRASMPTVGACLDAGAIPILMSHRGRPKGQVRPEFGMGPVADCLRGYVGGDVTQASDCVGDATRARAEALRPGDVMLLENLRFHAGETNNDQGFAARLGELAPFHVNDAFGTCHRAHASVVGVASHVRASAAGSLVVREVTELSRVLARPESPFVLVLGGAKVGDKVGVIGNLLPLVDKIVIGGAMANAFLAARGRAMGASKLDTDSVAVAGEMLERAARAGVEVVTPQDLVVAPSIDAGSDARVAFDVAAGEMALDIGPESRARFVAAVTGARTVVWNGPMGVFETEAFAAGTHDLARAIAGSGAFTVIGGGDTVAAASAAGVTDRISHISTGGGASLHLLSGRTLPGVAALSDRDALRL